MANKNPRRCVFGCSTKGVTIHDFPHPDKFPEQFQMWVDIVGEPVKNLTREDIYRKKKVCHVHFTERDWNRNNRLNALAVPSLHLPATAVSYAPGHEDHDYCKPVPVPMTETAHSMEVPSTSMAYQKEQKNNVQVPITVPSHSMEIQSTSEAYQKEQKIPFQDITNVQVPITVPSHSMEIQSTSAAYEKEQKLPFQDITNIQVPITVELHSMEIQPTSTAYQKEHEIPLDAGVLQLMSENTIPETNPKVSEHLSSPLRVKNTYSKESRKSPTLKLEYYKYTQRNIRNLKREIIRLRKRSKCFKTRLANAEKLNDEVSFQKVTRGMTVAAKLFTEMQFRQTNKKPKGRRFSIEQKILSLSLYKRSPKGYGLLSKCFTLPSPKTLKNLLSEIKIEPGINKLVFEKLKRTASEMTPEDNLCTLMFDEMYVTPQLKYDISKDCMKGFVTNGTRKIADHVLVFMVKGIKRNYKQPVAYYFTENLNKFELKNVLQDVVRKVSATGLNILCTICDQSTVNTGAINSLIEDTKRDYAKKGTPWKHEVFEIGKKKIIPLYDVPHLLKGVRNNLLTKDLKYVDFNDQNKEKNIKWSYFQQLYEADKSYGELRCMQKLTEEHVDANKINKMRVKLAAQVFSHSVAVAAEHLTARGDLSEECRNIIPFVLLVDKLFDSLNASTFNPQNGKIYKSAIKLNSPHHKLWQEAILFLKNVTFLTTKEQGAKIRLIEKKVPSITNLIKTLEGFQQVWNILHQKYKFDSMLTRNFNQDPLENFFGSIRSLGARNVSPDCVSFEGAYKALLLNNFCSRHSIRTNCEEDANTWFQTLDFFITNKETEQTGNINNYALNLELIGLNDAVPTEGSAQRNYVCGWVLKKCFQNVVKSCRTCREETTVSKDHLESNSFIVAKEYNKEKQWLLYPSPEVVKCFYHIQCITTQYLQTNLRKKFLKQDVKIFADIFATYPFSCVKHKQKLREYFENNVINVIICSWCRSINRILSGKLTYDGDDAIKVSAQIYFNKHKHMKNKK